MYTIIIYDRLDDFENSCAAYEKSLELTEDSLTLLNYAITLYSNDELEKAKKIFQKFEKLFKIQQENGMIFI